MLQNLTEGLFILQKSLQVKVILSGCRKISLDKIFAQR